MTTPSVSALRRHYWAWDNVHLGPGGHDLIAETVFAAIGSGGTADLQATAAASWMKARSALEAATSGETRLSSFEPGQEDLVNHGAGQVVREQASDYNSHYNRSVTVKPGRNTIDLDYTRLPRFATQKNDKPDYLDPRQITLVVFFLDQPAGGQPITLFFDNVRLAREPTGKVEVRPR